MSHVSNIWESNFNSRAYNNQTIHILNNFIALLNNSIFTITVRRILISSFFLLSFCRSASFVTSTINCEPAVSIFVIFSFRSHYYLIHFSSFFSQFTSLHGISGCVVKKTVGLNSLKQNFYLMRLVFICLRCILYTRIVYSSIPLYAAVVFLIFGKQPFNYLLYNKKKKTENSMQLN